MIASEVGGGWIGARPATRAAKYIGAAVRLPWAERQGNRIIAAAPVSLALQRGRAALQVRPGLAADGKTGAPS